MRTVQKVARRLAATGAQWFGRRSDGEAGALVRGCTGHGTTPVSGEELAAAWAQLSALDQHAITAAYVGHQHVARAADQRPELAEMLAPIVEASQNAGRDAIVDVIGQHWPPK